MAQRKLIELLTALQSKKNLAKVEFVTTPFPKDEVYNMWLAQIDKIERSTISTGPGDTTASDNALDIGFKLFPIIDSVSFNLYGKNGRHYLKKLGYSDLDADLMYSMFRNGQLHNANTYRLVYDDGEISWALSSSSGSGGFTPHDPGYIDQENPEDNVPADSAFDFENIGGTYYASLSLNRLTSHVKYDLEKRKAEDSRDEINFIVGQRVDGNMRKPKQKS